MARQYPRSYPPRQRYLRESPPDPNKFDYLQVLKGRATTQAKRQAQGLANLGMNQSVLGMFTNVMAHLNKTLNATERGGVRYMDDRIRDIINKDRAGMDPHNLKAVNMRVALAAQRSLVAGYSRRQPQSDLPAYRAGATGSRGPRAKRFANGALLRALGSPNFFRVTGTEIDFINVALLNKEAMHWRRLNFGTRGGARLKPPARFDIRWGSLLVGSLGLVPDVRPPFRLPPGVWVQPGIFYPFGEMASMGSKSIISATGQGSPAQTEARIRRGGRGAPLGPPNPRVPKLSSSQQSHWGKQNSRLTSGIASTNFLDVGIRRLAFEMGKEYQELVDDWLEKGLPDALRKLTVRQRYSTKSSDYSPDLQAKVRKQQRHLGEFNRGYREMIEQAKTDRRRIGAAGRVVGSRYLSRG